MVGAVVAVTQMSWTIVRAMLCLDRAGAEAVLGAMLGVWRAGYSAVVGDVAQAKHTIVSAAALVTRVVVCATLGVGCPGAVVGALAMMVTRHLIRAVLSVGCAGHGIIVRTAAAVAWTVISALLLIGLIDAVVVGAAPYTT